MTYSSVYGGLFQGSSGRLDAVATLVAILRVRLRHPGVPDHQLMEVRGGVDLCEKRKQCVPYEKVHVYRNTPSSHIPAAISAHQPADPPAYRKYPANVRPPTCPQVDSEFRDFMNCKLPPPGATKQQQDQAARPPAPPMPLAKDTSRYRPSSDDAAFPQRTVTTLGWVVAANGERAGRDHSAKALGFFPGERERWGSAGWVLVQCCY